MNILVSFLKKWFGFCPPRYPVAVEEIICKTKNSEPVAMLRFKDELLASKTKCSEILNGPKSLKEKIHPDDLLLLQKKYIKYCEHNQNIKIIEHLKDNKYKLEIQDFTITASGKDICKDINLLGKIDIHEAYKIIYSTAYLAGYHDYKHANLLSIEKEKKPIRLKIIAGNGK